MALLARIPTQKKEPNKLSGFRVVFPD
jgi:hypothetical protein